MKKVSSLRRMLLVNKSVQMRLVLYGFFVGLICALFAVNISVVAQRVLGLTPNAILVFVVVGLLVFAMSVILGLVVSNQIAGPILRLHRNIKRIADGERPEEIHIRKGDAYGDLFADYNRMIRKFHDPQ